MAWFDRDVLSADTILANSQGTSDRLRHWVGRPADEIIYPGVSQEFHPLDTAERLAAMGELASLGIIPPYILAVSTLEPRKNIGSLVEAFVNLKKRGELAQHNLVLVGARGWQNETLAHNIKNNAEHGIVLPGYVPDKLMPGVFALADVLVMPSLYEGFGMPVQEARAVGTPVIVSELPELKEAAAGQALVVSPSSEEIEKALLKILKNPIEKRLNATNEIQHWSISAQHMKEALTQQARKPPEKLADRTPPNRQQR
jgi:glycosyltransferase involved in cell wall biosynthesis